MKISMKEFQPHARTHLVVIYCSVDFVFFHNITCCTKPLLSRIHVNTTKLLNITCTHFGCHRRDIREVGSANVPILERFGYVFVTVVYPSILTSPGWLFTSGRAKVVEDGWDDSSCHVDPAYENMPRGPAPPAPWTCTAMSPPSKGPLPRPGTTSPKYSLFICLSVYLLSYLFVSGRPNLSEEAGVHNGSQVSSPTHVGKSLNMDGGELLTFEPIEIWFIMINNGFWFFI